ncbi:MAG: hypothetical protein LBU70_08810 [Chitinispirillales bacterium]|jgi:hypothetical protein|nr:hypothetical protein [Chitinispirillales bacterium]
MSKTFYLPANDLFGVWANSGDNAATPEFKEGVSVFKFTQTDDLIAEFSVGEDVSAQRAALNGLRRGWMSSSCDSAEFAPANAVGVGTVKPGVAKLLMGGEWKVNEKAVIEFKT